MLVDGATPLASDDSCLHGEEYWYERTPYRKIPYSSCEGGIRPDRGSGHACPGLRGHGFFFWVFVVFVPLSFAGLVGYWMYRRSGLARGCGFFFDRAWTVSDILITIVTLERSDSQGRTCDRRMRQRTRVSWTRSLPYRGTLSALLVSRGKNCKILYLGPDRLDHGEDIGTSLLMRTLKY